MLRCDVLVIGGGPAGLTAASLLGKKYDVVVLEEGKSPGGLALELSCKATDECLFCGVCRAVSAVQGLALQGFRLYTGERVTGVSRGNRSFSVTTNAREFKVRAVIVATGAVPFEVGCLPQYVWGRKKRIFSGFDVERGLRRGILEDFADFESLAFIQCVGSRNTQNHRGYCSQVCCRYALCLAENIRFRFPRMSIDFYYMDLQVFGDGRERLLEIARSLSCFRSMPFLVEEYGAGVVVSVEGKLGPEKRTYDAVILSVGMVPSPGTEKMAELFGLPLREGGFIRSFDGGKTLQEGVFVCGTASGPKDITDTILEAHEVGEHVAEFLGG